MNTRIASITSLLAIAFLAWGYSAYEFAYNRNSIVIQIADIAQALALPFRIAEMSMRPRDTVLPVPVQGVLLRRIADTWGDARSLGRSHEGVDIFARRGTPVYSATEGYVVRVGNGSLGGNFVFVVGPGGVRYYYAHLDTVALGIKTGTYVTPHSILGFVGNTGNAEMTAPHLHFGMYFRGAENPYPLLTERVW